MYRPNHEKTRGFMQEEDRKIRAWYRRAKKYGTWLGLILIIDTLARYPSSLSDLQYTLNGRLIPYLL
jgi:hypothetical protein